MLVFNLLTKIDNFTQEEWITWIQQVYLKKAMDSNYFNYCRVFQVKRNEKGGRTYIIQLYAKSKEDLANFMREIEPELAEEQMEKFRGRFMVEKTFMEFLEEIK